MNITDFLSESEKTRLQIIRLSRDEILFHEDERCESIGIVQEGLIQIISYLSEGKEIIYNTLQPGMIFGNNLLFSSQPFYKGNVVAINDTLVTLISKDDLISLLQNNKQFLEMYLRAQSDTAKNLNARIRLISIPSARERFLYYLKENGNELTYVSISELARQLGLTRETTSRLISRLCEEKRIKKTRKHISLL